ncbi:MAG: PucR family transcriptional regulator ligand-binding domain-containing protein [Anaerolineae bacterium]|nr:PucR family transcriptional regulator ligand-binding domain-containing protein [Anaerolineae bacterium]
MALTVAQALKFGGLARGRLLCGACALDNEIEIVSIIEAPLDRDWKTEKTLFLTSFYAVKDDIKSQLRTIEVLSDGKCAALVFQTGILDALPAEVLQRAEKLGLPIIEVTEEVPYPEIIQPLVGAMLQEKTYLLQRADDIHRRMIDLCLTGGGLDAIAAALNDLIKRPVRILDGWGSLITACPAETDDNFSNGLHKKLAVHGDLPGSHLIYLNDEKFWLMRFLSGSGRESDGYILIKDENKSLDFLDQTAVEQAAVVVALEIAKQRAVLEAERRIQRDFIENLLLDDHLPENLILNRAHSLGWDLQGKKVIAVINLADLRQFYLSRAGSTEEEFTLAKSYLVQSMPAILNELRPGGIVVEQGDFILLIPECEKHLNNAALRKSLQPAVENIYTLIKQTLGECPLYICFGGFYDTVQGLRNSFDEARSTLKVCRTQIISQFITWYDDVALYVLLDRIAEQPETRQWFIRTIGSLLDYDRENGTRLVVTLEAYFDANQQIQPAAYHLFVHPKTLKYRLRRIEDILGVNPFSPEQHLSYYLACKLARMLEFSHLR